MHFKIQSQPIGMFEILPSKNIAHVGMIFVVSLLPNTDKPILLLCPVSYWHCKVPIVIFYIGSEIQIF